MKKILEILLIGAMCSFLMGLVSESPPQNGEPLGISKMIEDLSQPVTLTAESYFCSNAPVYLSQFRTLSGAAMRYATVLNTKCKNIQLPAVERFNLRC